LTVMRNIAFILALALGAGNIVEAKCPPGDTKCSSETSDGEALLQSRTVVEEEAEDSMEDSVVEEMENEEVDTGLEEMDDSEEVMGDYMTEIDGLDWRSLLTEEGDAFMQEEENDSSMEDESPEIKDEAAEIEGTADEVEEGEVKEDRGGKGWKRIKKAAKRVVRHVRKAMPSFRTIWSQVVRRIPSGVGAFISDCSSLNDCKNKFFRGPKKLLDKIAKEAEKKAKRLSGDAAKAQRQVSKAWNWAKRHVKTTVKQTLAKVVEIGRAIVKAAKPRRKRLNMCTPRGYGLFKLVPTDCGAFSRLAQLFRSQPHQVPSVLTDVVRRFGQCVGKTIFRMFWTPFMNIRVDRWCVPSFVRMPIEYLVGSIESLPIKSAMIAIQKKFNGLFKQFSFLEQAAAAVGSKVHGNASHYSIEHESESSDETESEERPWYDGRPPRCLGNDFTIFIAMTGGMKFPSGSAIMAGLTFSTGCYHKRFFAEIAFSVIGSLWLTGFRVDCWPVCENELGAGITFGFKVPVKRASRAIVSWQAQVSISGKVAVRSVEAGLALGFKVLPTMGPPTGFSISPKVLVLALPQTQVERQQELDSAMAEHETLEDQFYAGVGTMMGQLNNLDLSSVMESGALMSVFQDGAAALAQEEATGEESSLAGASEEEMDPSKLVESEEDELVESGEKAIEKAGTGDWDGSKLPPVEFKEGAMHAQLQVNFCFSCIPEGLPWYCVYGMCW